MSCWNVSLVRVLELVTRVCKRLNLQMDRIYLPVEWLDRSTLTMYIDASDLAEEYGKEFVEHLAKLVEIIAKKHLEKARVEIEDKFIDIHIPLC